MNDNFLYSPIIGPISKSTRELSSIGFPLYDCGVFGMVELGCKSISKIKRVIATQVFSNPGKFINTLHNPRSCRCSFGNYFNRLLQKHSHLMASRQRKRSKIELSKHNGWFQFQKSLYMLAQWYQLKFHIHKSSSGHNLPNW